MVVRESYDPRLDGVIDAHRVARGLAVIHRGRPGASFRIVRALRSGKPVGFLPDLGGRVPSIQVQFLGELTAFPVGPQQIAQRLGAPLVIGTLYRNREGAPFGLRIDEVDTEAPLADLTQRVASLLEQAIYASPNDFPLDGAKITRKKRENCGTIEDNGRLVGYLPISRRSDQDPRDTRGSADRYPGADADLHGRHSGPSAQADGSVRSVARGRARRRLRDCARHRARRRGRDGNADPPRLPRCGAVRQAR